MSVFWDDEEASLFKGARDGIGETVNRKLYHDVLFKKELIQNANQLADYNNKMQ